MDPKSYIQKIIRDRRSAAILGIKRFLYRHWKSLRMFDFEEITRERWAAYFIMYIQKNPMNDFSGSVTEEDHEYVLSYFIP